MANVWEPAFVEEETGGFRYRRARIAEQAGAEHIGASLYELEPGAELVFHYHLAVEEMLIVLRGRVAVRTPAGWGDADAGEVVVFPRGERGAHAVANRSDSPVRFLMLSELHGPNVSVYPDENRIGIYDEPLRERRRFGALFDLGDALGDYAGGRASLEPPS